MKNGLRRFFPFGALPCIVGLLVISGGIRLGAIGLAVANEATNPTVQSVSEELQCPSNPDKEKLLLEISERMAALDAYETELSKREERLNAAKVLVQNNLRNLVAAEEKLANTIARVDGASEEDLARLTSVYESMKPKVAASLFEQMEPSFAAGFLGRMNPQAAAGIMSSLSTEAGYAISVVLAEETLSLQKNSVENLADWRVVEMIGIVGIIIVFAMVFGGYLAAGGKFDIIIKALPFEMTMIGGAALGAFVIGNDMAGIKHTAKDVGKVFKGPKWLKTDYQDLLCLLYELIRIARKNPVELEPHIEAPGESTIFGRYPKIQGDRESVELICDTLRSAGMNFDDPHQVEEVLEKRIEANQHHALHSSHALQTIADGLPALGIVAAVLGVIKTMGSIDQPPEVLGKLIGGALVGTFLGVFLAYGFFGPFASKVKTITEQDGQFHLLIREVLVANLHNHAINICIEVGRQNTPGHVRPSFGDLEQALKETKQAAA